MDPDALCYDVICRECERAQEWVRRACNGWLLFALGAATGSVLGAVAYYLWSVTEVATTLQDILLILMLGLAMAGGTMLIYTAVVWVGRRVRQMRLRTRSDANGIHFHLPPPRAFPEQPK